MPIFKETTYLSEIIEESSKIPVIIFIHSSTCNISKEIERDIVKAVESKFVVNPIYKITVQTMPALSKKVEEGFNIKHESPQIIIINKNKVTYSADHRNIKVKDFTFI